MALQPNVRSTGALWSLITVACKKSSQLHRLQQKQLSNKSPKSQLEEVDIGAQFLKGRLALIQEKDFVPFFVFTLLCIASRETFCIIITVSQTKSSAVFCKFELLFLAGKLCLKFHLILG